MNKLIAILLVASLVLLGISAFKNLDYSQQIQTHAQALEIARNNGYSSGYDAGYSAGHDEGYDAGYSEGHDTGYNKGRYNRIMASVAESRNRQVLPTPASGTILSGRTYYGSTITIKSDTESSCVVCLKTASGEERMAFFVRAGDTVTVNVPAEKLYAYFAYGSIWYGYGEGLMFGDETSYSRDDESLDFSKYTYTYTLYPTYDGNYTETPSDEDEFFG